MFDYKQSWSGVENKYIFEVLYMFSVLQGPPLTCIGTSVKTAAAAYNEWYLYSGKK